MFKSVVKVCGSTVKLQLILDILSAVEAGGIRGVAVKCLDITKNSDCEGQNRPPPAVPKQMAARKPANISNTIS